LVSIRELTQHFFDLFMKTCLNISIASDFVQREG